jgi:signal transduction histidine kinase
MEQAAGLHGGAVSGSALARLAHELRTPLSAITAAAELMRDERFGPIGDSRYRGYAGDIHENARHALAVTERMLEPGASMPRRYALNNAANPDDPRDTGPFELVFAEVDISELVERLASSVRALVEASRLDLTLDIEPNLPRLVIDAVTVRQMLLNLVQNAVRATPPGGTIALSVRWTAPATTYTDAALSSDQERRPGPLVITVSDTGHGMDPSLVAGLLAGQTADDDQRAFDHGTGIGFPLVMRLATANGARISIDSELAHGTRVAIAFPASRIVM